jgi:HD-GYP domain-containing protein (c-di-GMP phosphodiesterase class II)
MIKKIKTENLDTGMYIHDFNCDWLRHPFFGNSLMIDDDKVINKLIEYGICEVYIDTDKGQDAAGAQTRDEVQEEIQHEIDKVIEPVKKTREPVSVNEEIIKAKVVKKEATDIVLALCEDVRHDKPIKVDKVEYIVDNVVDSILRNQDALMSLSRIRTADVYTYSHSISVCVHLVSFGKYLGYDHQKLKEVGIGALLHDIGKMKVPKDLLNKRGRLNESEYDTIKEHVVFTQQILEQSPYITETSILTACQHHERVDGKGYPNGLRGDDITEHGQAIAIVDVYDAITSDRSYKNRIEPAHALKKLFEWSKFHFNKELVQKFIRCVGIFPVGTLVMMESGWIGIVIKQGEKNLLEPVVRLIFNTKTEYHPRVPHDIDLADQSNNQRVDRIVDFESTDKWHLQPEMYL